MTRDDSRRSGKLPLSTTVPGRGGTVDETTRDLPLSPYGLEAEHDLAARFVDQGEIARGGMGKVHRVLERSLNRFVAMKVLAAEKATEARAKNRFIAEAQITGQLEHPNIVPVYELGVDEAGAAWFTMKLVEGQTLSAFLNARDASSDDEALQEALEIFAKVCDALSFAHSRGVIHRDVKPGNIMTGEHGQVYMMDWGIALVAEPGGAGPAPAAAGHVDEAPARAPLPPRRTTSLTAFPVEGQGLVLGTYAYMSPEQARGDLASMDARTDVFGLGAVLFRIVTGRPPFVGDSELDTLARAAEGRLPDVEPLVRGRLRRTLAAVALRAMRRERDERYQTVADLKRAVESVQRGALRFPTTRVPAGTRIIEEGSRGDEAYVVKHGECRVFRVVDGASMTLRTIGPGGVFGETAVFTGQPRNASVEALTDVEMWVVPGRVLQEELGLDSWLGAFVRSLGARFTDASTRLGVLEGVLKREQVVRGALLAMTRRRASAVLLDDVAAEIGMEPARVREVLLESGLFAVEADGATLRVVGS